MYKKLLVLLLLFCIKSTYAQFTPALINVDTAITKNIKSKSFYIKNPVNRAIQITNIRTLTQQFTLNSAPFNINPFDSALVTISFYTNQNITYRDFFIFENNGLNSPIVYYLVATAKYPDALYSFTQGLIDEPLKTALRTFTTTGYITLGYNTARDHMYGTIDHYESPDTLECVYTGRRAYIKTRAQATNQGFNCEHTYPQGFFNSADPMVSDIFHLYPTDDAANSARGNYPFGLPLTDITYNVGGSKLGKDFQGETVFEPRNVHKGNVARSLIYFSVKYSGNYGGFMTAKQEGILRQWNVFDTVDSKERLRNTRIKSFQNVYNPFIDHPELVERIKSTYSVIPAVTKSEISASPFNVLFDTLAVNDTSSFFVAVMNYGTGNLSINSVTSSIPQFIVESIPASVPQNELRYIKVKFKPTETNQTYNGVLTIQNPDSNITVNLRGFSNMQTGIITISTQIPQELTLMQNYPNPFNPVTRIRFAVPFKLSGVYVTLRIYDLTGKEIANPINTNMNAGYYETEFNGSNLASGVYIYKIQAGSFTEQKKFTLIK
ncbi:MAG: endonuclease [Candidatus Kapaibacterium sp.]